MAQPHEVSPEHVYIQPDHNQKLANVLEARPDKILTDKQLSAMVVTLDTMYGRYGDPSTESYHSFHNNIHAFNVGTGSWIILDFWRDQLKLDIKPRDYAVGGFVGGLHDIFHEHTGPDGFVTTGDYEVDFGEFSVTIHTNGDKSNEQMSAECARLFLAKVSLSKLADDVVAGIELTEVTFEKNGNVVQKGAGKGGKNYGGVAAAIADTNGMFVDGERLTKDGARLIVELHPDDINDEQKLTGHIAKFIASEKIFVNQKLGEFMLHVRGLEDDPDKRQIIVDRFHEHFEPYRRRALGAAAMFDEKLTNIQQLHDAIESGIDAIKHIIRPSKKITETPNPGITPEK